MVFLRIGVKLITSQVKANRAKADIAKAVSKVPPEMSKFVNSIEADLSDLSKFTRDIGKANKDLGKRVKQIGKAVAQETVLPTVKQRAAEGRPSLGGGTTRLGSAGIAKIRAVQAKQGGAIKAGGAKVPWFLGHEWGSERFAQFPPSTKEGYIVRPAIAEKQPEFLERYLDEVEKALGSAFPD